MKKIIIASVAATALIAGLSVAKAAEPGEEQYFYERGNINAAQLRGPAPDLNGWQIYGGPAYGETGFGQAQAPLGYAPGYDSGYDDE